MNVSQWSLSNGIRVCTIHHPATPLMHLSWNVHAGAAYESIPGLAHLCEHLMFTGTHQYPDYDAHLTKIGASNNAWTNYDITSFDVESTNENLSAILQLESDRLLHLAQDISEALFAKEQNVVCNEFNESFEEDPLNHFFHAQPIAMFGRAHPYGHPIIGTLHDIRRITKYDCQQFIQHHYCANNISVCLSSGYTHTEMEQLIRDNWSSIPSNSSLKSIDIQPPSFQTSLFQTTITQAPPFFSFEWILPDTKFIAARTLAILLNSAQYGLLYRQLEIEKEYVSNLDIDVEERDGFCIFGIQGLLNKESFREKVKECCFEILRKIAQADIDAFLVRKTTKNLKLLWLLSLETQVGQHDLMNSWIQKNRKYTDLISFIEAHQHTTLHDISQLSQSLCIQPYLEGQNHES